MNPEKRLGTGLYCGGWAQQKTLDRRISSTTSEDWLLGFLAGGGRIGCSPKRWQGDGISTKPLLGVCSVIMSGYTSIKLEVGTSIRPFDGDWVVVGVAVVLWVPGRIRLSHSESGQQRSGCSEENGYMCIACTRQIRRSNAGGYVLPTEQPWMRFPEQHIASVVVRIPPIFHQDSSGPTRVSSVRR